MEAMACVVQSANEGDSGTDVPGRSGHGLPGDDEVRPPRPGRPQRPTGQRAARQDQRLRHEQGARLRQQLLQGTVYTLQNSSVPYIHGPRIFCGEFPYFNGIGSVYIEDA